MIPLEPGCRLLEDDEIIDEGDKFFSPDPKLEYIARSWEKISRHYCHTTVKKCKSLLVEYYGSMYFATSRPEREPDPEPIVIGKLLESING